MPRRRMLDPEFWSDSRIKRLSVVERFFFLGMMSQADDEGRLLADPAFLRARIFPYDDLRLEDIRNMLDHILKTNPNLQFYQHGGESYLFFRKWERYQKPSHPQESRIPPPSQLTESIQHDDGVIPGVIPGTIPGEIPAQDREGQERSGTSKGGRRKTPSPLKETARTMCAGDLLSTVKPDNKDDRAKDVPAKRQKRPPDPRVNEIQVKMKRYLGYPERTSKDPIPSYGKEGKAIKRMLDRLFTPEEILACWQAKVEARDGDYVNMTWVNEDIGKKQGPHPSMGRSRNGRWPRDLPEKYTPAPKYRDD